MVHTTSDKAHLRVAVVGAGPVGIYIADVLAKAPECAMCVDLIEKRPAPFGLLNYGGPAQVPAPGPTPAPAKASGQALVPTLAPARVRVLGNIEVGTDVTVAELRRFYDAVVITGPAGRAGAAGPGAAGPDAVKPVSVEQVAVEADGDARRIIARALTHAGVLTASHEPAVGHGGQGSTGAQASGELLADVTSYLRARHIAFTTWHTWYELDRVGKAGRDSGVPEVSGSRGRSGEQLAAIAQMLRQARGIPVCI